MKPKICEICKKRQVHHEHHKDGNHKNNKPENLQYLCTLCHAEIHDILPKQSELKRMVIFRDRAVKRKNIIENQIRGFGRIEYVIPEELTDEYKSLLEIIKQYEKETKKLLKTGNYPLWERLETVKRISFITASKLISHIDIRHSPYPSSLCQYCGYGDPKYIKRKKGMKQAEAKRCGNPYLKKELYVLADNFIKQRTPIYRDIYDEEKEKQMNNGSELSKGHAHNRAIRKMNKIFLIHYWLADREVNELLTSKPYVEAHLGHNHIIPLPF